MRPPGSWTIGDQDAAARVYQAVQREARAFHGDEGPPTRAQVAMVLHALADHTLILVALDHRRDPDSPWPNATSVGRFLHDLGDYMVEEAG